MRDDSPLYIFDGSFGDKRTSRSMLRDYSVPAVFQEDLFQYAGGSRRPPYRWMVIGPARTGSCLHVDPLGTAAWNALVSGHKRWALYPPHVPKSDLLPPGFEREGVVWFQDMYPKTRDKAWPHPPPLDCIQGPGEIIFVPSGWWHAVLNLDMTVAVTQNFVTSHTFDVCWRWARKSRPKMSQVWLGRLREVRPDLAARADAIERADDYDGYNTTSSSSSSSSSSSEESGSDGGAEEEAESRRRMAMPVGELYPYIITNPKAQEPWRFAPPPIPAQQQHEDTCKAAAKAYSGGGSKESSGGKRKHIRFGGGAEADNEGDCAPTSRARR